MSKRRILLREPRTHVPRSRLQAGRVFPAIDAIADPDRPDSLPQNALIAAERAGALRFEMYGDLHLVDVRKGNGLRARAEAVPTGHEHGFRRSVADPLRDNSDGDGPVEEVLHRAFGLRDSLARSPRHRVTSAH